MTVNANTQIFDKVVDRAAMLRLYERRVNQKIEVVLDGHTVRVADVLANADLSVRGQRDLYRKIDEALVKTFQEAYKVSSNSLIDLFKDQVSFTVQSLSATIGKVWNVQKPVRRVAEEFVLEKPLYNDQTLAAGWGGVSISERKRLELIIRKGIAERKTIEEIAVEVRKNNVHSITRNQSRSLVVTAVTSVSNQADHSVYRANSGAIQGWQYVAILDSRTTPTCAFRDGQIYGLEEVGMLPPAHYGCRSTTTPVFKSWSDMGKLEGLAEIRRRNLNGLTDQEKAFYDGQTPLRESYNDWLFRQPQDVQLRHLGDYSKVELFQSGQLTLDKFTNPEGNSLGIRELRQLTDSEHTAPNDTRRFAAAKQQLDSMQLWASTPDDFIDSPNLRKTLADYYKLQAGELDGTLSLINYRGALIGTKKQAKRRVLTTPPTEEQLKFNPITGRYEDVRMYQPNPTAFENNKRLVLESDKLLDRDKAFIIDFVDNELANSMGINERAVITDNLRIIFGRQRENVEPWANFKAVNQAQIKFDVMNLSDTIETQLRKDTDLMKRLAQDNYIDPVLGAVQLQDLHDNFISNVFEKNRWEDTIAPKLAGELRQAFDRGLALKHPIIWERLSESQLKQFYLRFANRLSMADTPDRDQFAVALGRDLYNSASLNGDRKKWYELGMDILHQPHVDKFYKIETFGVQKRRMKSRLSNAYFGPYYDTLAYNIRVVDPRIQRYAQLTRKVDIGLRVAVTDDRNKLVFREGFKTYFVDRGILGLEDTRIPITSTNSFGDFPPELVDKSLADALSWASQTKYKIDPDYYDFVNKLLNFEDDRGKAKYYADLNEYKKYIASRGDAYERFKSMEWLRKKEAAFSNHAFVDHRARVYDRGLISPQSGETFRPFLNTAESKKFSPEEFKDFMDQTGAFLGGLNDRLEGNFNSLTITGRQKIAERLRPQIVDIGNKMIRAKPNDIRSILESEIVTLVDGEELGKFFRFAIETAKIDNYLGGDYSVASLNRLRDYDIALALEQDASSSGAQIIALTTKNKQLAELSNVVPTTQKRRLYDEIAASTFNDPRFREMNVRFGLNEKDLRKAAKAQNMVTFYGAGERTGILNVEGKLGKILGKDKGTLVVKASDRDTVLNEISAQAARYKRFDPGTADELNQLRSDVRDIFNKGQQPSDDIMEALWFLDPKTKDLVEKMTHTYDMVVTPDDFSKIAKIMSEYLGEQVPILKDFTKFFGRLAEAFLGNAKPSNSAFQWETIFAEKIRGSRTKGYTLPDSVSRLLGLKAGEPVSVKVLKRFGFFNPGDNLADMLLGVKAPDNRRAGGSFFKVSFPGQELVDNVFGKGNPLSKKWPKIVDMKIGKANKLPKSWTNVPWVNFDGKVIEQNFTQSFEERLAYRNAEGKWTNNILHVAQKTELSWWEQILNESGKINDIADVTKARTAFAVNGNHSNDAVIVKQFHLWGKANGIPTSTIHDAFFANAADMLKARQALREIYAKMLNQSVVKMTLDEMLKRGLPKEIYDKFLNEAIDIGLIPVVGRSRVGGRLLTIDDILTEEDILQQVPADFKEDLGWYGVG
jgi:SPP1 gp7 family putative phage head morphogenesis protein